MPLALRTMPIRIALALTVIVLGSAAAALAQGAPAAPAQKPESTTVGEVVVQGRTQTTQSFAKDVEKFVLEEGHTGPLGQISRWAQPICPMTAGLSPGFAEFVNKRIEAIAARVGAPGSERCGKGVNVMVVFTTVPDELMADVRRHHEALLGFHGVGETRDLSAFRPPMKSWHVTMTRAPGYLAIDTPYTRLPNWGASHTPPPTKSEFAFALVVVDAKLLEGQAIGPVADRIAMLTLSNPAPRDSCGPLPTIMDLLEPNCAADGSTEGLTSYDEAYLKALYAFKAHDYQGEDRSFERRAIAKGIIKFAGPPPAP